MKCSNLFQTVVADVERNRHKRNPFDQKYLELCSTSIENDDESAATNVHVRVELLRCMGQHLQKQLGFALRHCDSNPVHNKTRACRQPNDNAQTKEITKLIQRSPYRKLMSHDIDFLNSFVRKLEHGRSRHVALLHEIHLDPVKECPSFKLHEFFISKFNTSNPGKITAMDLITNPLFNQADGAFLNEKQTPFPMGWSNEEDFLTFHHPPTEATIHLPPFQSIFNESPIIEEKASCLVQIDTDPPSEEENIKQVLSPVKDAFPEEEMTVDCDFANEGPSPYEFRISDASDVENQPKKKRKNNRILRSPSPGLNLLKSLNQTLKQKRKTKTPNLKPSRSVRMDLTRQGQEQESVKSVSVLQKHPVISSDAQFDAESLVNVDSHLQDPRTPTKTFKTAIPATTPVQNSKSRLSYARPEIHGRKPTERVLKLPPILTANQLRRQEHQKTQLEPNQPILGLQFKATESSSFRMCSKEASPVEECDLEISEASESIESISEDSVKIQETPLSQQQARVEMMDAVLNGPSTREDHICSSLDLEIESCTSEESSEHQSMLTGMESPPPITNFQEDMEFSISGASSEELERNQPSQNQLSPVKDCSTTQVKEEDLVPLAAPQSNELEGLLNRMRISLKEYFNSNKKLSISLQELLEAVNGSSLHPPVSIKRLFFAALHLTRKTNDDCPMIRLTSDGELKLVLIEETSHH